jgi:hypothetical protein
MEEIDLKNVDQEGNQNRASKCSSHYEQWQTPWRSRFAIVDAIARSTIEKSMSQKLRASRA